MVVAPPDNAVPNDEDDDSKYYDSNDDMDALAVDNGCTEDDLRAIKQARRLVASGHMHRASRAAATTLRTLDCNDSAVLQQLRQLHPAASSAPMPALPRDADSPIVLNDNALQLLVRRCNNSKAGEPSGWNGAMLAVLADSQICMAGICRLISDITLGRIPPAVRAHITATRLITLAKPNGAPRPIAMGELFYRVAAVHAVRAVSNSARGLLAPHQYGVGVPGGCEYIVHSMQHSLSHIADNRPLAAVKVDISNAFNNCQRPRLLSLLFDTPQLGSLHRLAHWAYSQPTPLIPHCKGAASEERFIESANGLRQGDPLSTLLFCLYLKPAIDALASDPAFGARIQIYAYVDDVHIVGAFDDVLTAHMQFIQHLRAIELAVNPDKCSLVYFHQRTHPLTTVQSLAVTGAGLQWTEEHADSADVLGAAIGVDAAAVGARLDRNLGGAAGLFGPFIRRVQSGGFAVQAAMLLLAHSVSRLACLQRCLPPAALEQVARDWDTMLLKAASCVLDLAADEAADSKVQATLQRPRRLGGFGLLSAVFVSPLAFSFFRCICSCIRCTGWLPPTVGRCPPACLAAAPVAARGAHGPDHHRRPGPAPRLHRHALRRRHLHHSLSQPTLARCQPAAATHRCGN